MYLLAKARDIRKRFLRQTFFCLIFADISTN